MSIAEVHFQRVPGHQHKCYICGERDGEGFIAHKVDGIFCHHFHERCLTAWSRAKDQFICLECRKPYRKELAYPVGDCVVDSLKVGLVISTALTRLAELFVTFEAEDARFKEVLLSSLWGNVFFVSTVTFFGLRMYKTL